MLHFVGLVFVGDGHFVLGAGWVGGGGGGEFVNAFLDGVGEHLYDLVEVLDTQLFAVHGFNIKIISTVTPIGNIIRISDLGDIERLVILFQLRLLTDQRVQPLHGQPFLYLQLRLHPLLLPLAPHDLPELLFPRLIRPLLLPPQALHNRLHLILLVGIHVVPLHQVGELHVLLILPH